MDSAVQFKATRNYKIVSHFSWCLLNIGIHRFTQTLFTYGWHLTSDYKFKKLVSVTCCMLQHFFLSIAEDTCDVSFMFHHQISVFILGPIWYRNIYNIKLVPPSGGKGERSLDETLFRNFGIFISSGQLNSHLLFRTNPTLNIKFTQIFK